MNDVFPSKWLKADDIPEDGDLIVTIEDARMEEMKDKNNGPAQKKVILDFREDVKPLICNKVNATTIAGIHGDDTDDWIGKRIALYTKEVEFAGEMMLGIRVRLKAPKGGAAAPAADARSQPTGRRPAQPAAAASGRQAPPPDDAEDEDESIPF
jgi:hypothetical protein